MSSTEILEPAATSSKTSGNHHAKHGPKSGGGNNNSKRKNKHDRGGRKRSKSFTGCFMPVLPSKFLLGGNIKDPLNLNSLQDEEINRAMNAVTPKSSPVPTPPRKKGQLEVIIPKNIHDPLNLIDCDDDVEYEQQLNSPIKKSKKKRLKKRRTVSATMDTTDIADTNENSEAKTPENSTDSAKVPEMPDIASQPSACKNLLIDLALPKKDKKRKSDDHAPAVKKFKNNSMDKIVSPVVPQPGAWLKRSNSVIKPKHRPNKNIDSDTKMPEFKDKNKQFQYGNYNRYYGYRNPNQDIDHRLRVFSHHAYLFDNKDILDIGCNIGHITLSIARDFRARSIIGIDIDPRLISIARKNTKHYVKTEESPRGDEKPPPKNSSEFFPISMPILYGAIDIPGFHDTSATRKGFPNNVTFKQCNYILDDDNLINLEQPQFDIILCLSVTKWFHLNWGDSGLKQAFRRMYAQLKPGGKLILEPQHWASYKSKKKLTETIYKNYNSIEFFPEKFREYLLSPAVGFAKSEILGYPQNHSKGFQRPIQIFTKSTMFPSERIEATPINITVGGSAGSTNDYDKFRTEKYEGQTHVECVQHVYTNLFDNRYCGCSDETADINEKIGEELKKVLEKPESLPKNSKTDAKNKLHGESEIDCECEQVKAIEQDTNNSGSELSVDHKNNTDNVKQDGIKSVENFNVDNT